MSSALFELWCSSRPGLLTSVVLPLGSSDDEVRAEALARHALCPYVSCPSWMAPFEFEGLLRSAVVRRRGPLRALKGW